MIKSEVEKLYKGDFAISSPKEIDIEAIALCLGASIKYRPLKGCEARIVGVKNRAIISINSNSHPQRNRFSIGHELGHWMKHRGNVGNLCSKELITVNKSSNLKKIIGKEIIANKFASELLMPSYLVSAQLKNTEFSLEIILSIKDSFNVSLTAAAIKYVDMCDYPVVLACYNQPRGRKWFHRSKQVPETFFPKYHVDQTSPGYINLTLNKTSYVSREVDACTWVDYKGSEEHEVMEVVWKVSDSDFMVLFWWHNEEQIIDY